MKKMAAFAILAALALPLQLAAKEILVSKGTVRQESISAFNKKIVIAGEVRDSLFLVGSELTLSGTVRGDVIMIAGSLWIEPGAVIEKDLIIFGADSKIPPDFKPGGEFFNIKSRKDLREMASRILPFFPQEQKISFFIVLKIVAWLLIALFVLALLPRQVTTSHEMLRGNWKRYLFTGVLLFGLLVIFIFFSVILSVFLIGLPLLLLLLFIYIAMIIFGRTVVFYAVGALLFEKLRIRKPDPAFYVIPGALLYTIGKLLGLGGLVIVLAIDFFALSCSFFYIFRKRFNSQERS